jgi:hypothetical protein
MYAHYFGTFTVAFAVLALLLRGRRSLLPAAVPLLVTAAGMIPLILLMAQQRRTSYTSGISFSSDGTLPAPVAALRSMLVLGNGNFTEGIVKLLGFVGFAAVIAWIVWSRYTTRPPRPNLQFPLVLAGSLLVLMHACALVLHWPLRDSYQAILAPGAYLTLAIALPLGTRAGRMALAALLLVMATGSVPLALGKGRQNPDFRSGARVVAESQPDGILLARGWGDLACYEFYRQEHAPTAAYMLDPIRHPNEEVRIVGRDLTTAEQLVASRPRRLCVLGKDSALPGFSWMTDFLQQHGYVQQRKQHFEGLEVAFWERKASPVAQEVLPRRQEVP